MTRGRDSYDYLLEPVGSSSGTSLKPLLTYALEGHRRALLPPSSSMLAGMLSCAKADEGNTPGMGDQQGKKNWGPNDFWSREAILVQMFIHESKINISCLSRFEFRVSTQHS